VHLLVRPILHQPCPLPRCCPYMLTPRSLRQRLLLPMMTLQLLLLFSKMLLPMPLGGCRDNPTGKQIPKMSKGFMHSGVNLPQHSYFSSYVCDFDSSDVLQYLIVNQFVFRLLSSIPVLRLHSQFYGSATGFLPGFNPADCLSGSSGVYSS
jgi:hypothetical protein